MPFELGQTTIDSRGRTRYMCDRCGGAWGSEAIARDCCTHQCDECGSWYMYDEDAEVCCGPQCADCGARHETWEAAEECCMYRCQHCGALHSYEDEAYACCANYECPGCGALHHTEEQAGACCGMGTSVYPEHIREIQPSYLIHIPELPNRPVRLSSIEQELCSGSAPIARLLYDMGLSEYAQLQSYGRDANPGMFLIKHDGSLPPGGGEVVYSRLNLADQGDVMNLSRALAGIRALKNEGLVETTTAAGTHYHVSAVDINGGNIFGPGQMAALYEMFSFSEEVLFHIASAGWEYHRGQGYSSILPKYEKGGVKPGLVGRHARSNRYFGLNFARLMQAAQQCSCGACTVGDWAECDCRVLRNGTIEWRIFNASTKPETIHAWALLCHAMTEAAFTHEIGSLEANQYGATDPEKHPWIFGWILDTCPLTDPEKQVIVNCAKRSRNLQINWEEFDANHEDWGEVPQPEESMRPFRDDEVEQDENTEDMYLFTPTTTVTITNQAANFTTAAQNLMQAFQTNTTMPMNWFSLNADENDSSDYDYDDPSF